MKPETTQHARDMFTSILHTATGLGEITLEERTEVLKIVAELCFEAAIVFEKVAETKK